MTGKIADQVGKEAEKRVGDAVDEEVEKTLTKPVTPSAGRCPEKQRRPSTRVSESQTTTSRPVGNSGRQGGGATSPRL
jgi:hypothetical protein